MIVIFQTLFTLAVVLTIGVILGQIKKGAIIVRNGILWIGVWILAGIIVWLPESTSYVATLLGIGRGVDVVTYCAIAIMFYILFRMNIKLEKLNRDITTLVRNQTVKNKKK